MRKIVTLLLILLTVSVQGQIFIKERKPVQVLHQQTFYLNSTARAALGGKSKTWFNVPLPPNTVEWYYSFTTTKGEKSKASVELFAQLTKLIDPTGITAVATTAIFTMSGAGVCDIYLMDKDNANIFLEKNRNRDSFDYDLSASRENFRNGTVRIDNYKGQECYLGFKNPSPTEGVAITFEIVAIVEETRIIERPLAETKAEIFGTLGRKAYLNGNYDMCLDLSLKAIKGNVNLGWVYNNLGLVYLIRGDYVAAVDSYATAIALFAKSDKAQYWINEAITDLRALIEKYGQLEGAAEILEMFVGQKDKLMGDSQQNTDTKTDLL